MAPKIRALVGLCLLAWCRAQEAGSPQQCSIADFSKIGLNLQEMTYDVGDGEQTTLVYVEPDVATFYQGVEPPARTKVHPKFKGFSGKMINMSNKPVSFYWESSAGGTKHPMRNLNPFFSTGTATFPTHRFLFTELEQPDKVLKTFVMGDYPENVYYYDPYHVDGDPKATETNLSVLTKEEREMYDGWRKTLLFNEQYLAKTGRSYLANYIRGRPIHNFWPADYFGQEHWITTRETHIVKHPPEDELDEIMDLGKKRVLKESDPRSLEEYRDPNQQILNMTLKVLSVVPRAFEIPNFLSEVEVEHILKLAAGIELSLSGTGEVLAKGERKVNSKDQSRTRTSFNSWVKREMSPIIDIIYRRAADLLRIDEALLRYRDDDEFPEIGSRKSLAEHLQLVHYGLTQEYTAHHDFGFSSINNKKQDARFATLLLYLNEGMTGGETSFPRWGNAETFKKLNIKPKIGKAVLFYSQLPDGNMDDFSQHAALRIIEGEKWLINLWVHDPVYEKD